MTVVTVHAGAGDSCSLPGEDVADGNTGTDVGFSAGPSNGEVGAPANYPSENIQSLYWAEPAGLGGAVAITMKVDTLAPADPASTSPTPDQVYEEFFDLDDGRTYYVQYDPNAAVGQQFTYGLDQAADNNGDTVDTMIGFTDPASTANPNGTITWVVSRAKMGPLGRNGLVRNIFGIVKIGTTPDTYQAISHSKVGTYQLHGSCGGPKSGVLGAGAMSPMAALVLGFLSLLGIGRRMRSARGR